MICPKIFAGIAMTVALYIQMMRIHSKLWLPGLGLLLLVTVFAAELPAGTKHKPGADGRVPRPERPNPSQILAYIPSRDQNSDDAKRHRKSCADPNSWCTWEHTFGGALQDKAYGIASLPDDGLIVVGNSRSQQSLEYNAWILRLSRDGKILWERSFGGSSSDQLYAVASTPDGGVVVAGHTRSKGAGKSDVWILRLNLDGELLWERTFGGLENDRARTIDAMADGGFVIAGMTQSYGSPQGDAWIIKLDSKGRRQWDRSYGGNEEYAIFSIAALPDSSAIATGYTNKGKSHGFELWVIRLSSHGDRIWDRHYGRGIFDAGTAILPAVDGGAMVAGVTSDDGFQGDDAWIIRLDASGHVIWDQTFGGPKPDSAWSVVEMPGTGYAVTMATLSYGAGSSDAWVICLNDDGAVIWQRLFGGQLWDRPTTAALTQDGGLAVAGYTTTTGAGYEDFWVFRVDARGQF
jgi:uncharacterized delta-60 repeat protein